MLLREPGDERRREHDDCDEDREHGLPRVGVELPSAFRRYVLLRDDDLNSGSFSAMPEIIRPSGSHQTAPGGVADRVGRRHHSPGVPRNVVTLSRRSLVLPSRANRDARKDIISALGETYRLRQQDSRGKWWELDFPKSVGRRAAKERVSADLDRIDPLWRRLFVLYPTKDSLRRRGR